MSRSKIYTLDYLESIRDNKVRRSDCRMKPICVVNKLISLFPIISTNNAWAFYCICGNFCIQDASAVYKGLNKSCGCHKKTTNKSEVLLKTLKSTLNKESTYTLIKEGSSARGRDWGFSCNVCGVSSTDLCRFDVLTQKRKFCRCSDCYICDREEALEDLEKKLVASTWNLVNFPEDFTYKSHCRVDLGCKVCGTPKNMLYGNAIRGKGCLNCANIATKERVSKDLDWFIEEANRVHDYKYDYSLSIYTTARSHLDIICHEHGEPFIFPQSPDNHKNKGKGCPECKRLRLKYVSFHKAKVEENKEKYKQLNSGVYLFELGGFYKVGLSCNDHKRSLEVAKASKLPVRVLGYLPCNLYEAFFLENFLHRKYETYRYYSETEWEGHTECFDLEDSQVKDVLSILGGRNDNNTK